MAGGDERVVWLTGFAPFAGFRANPSGLIARALDGTQVGGARVIGRVLPVSLARTDAALAGLARLPRPAAILSLGLFGGASAVQLERVAANRIEFAIADNDGARPVPQPIAAEGPAALWATLPVDAIRTGLLRAGIPTITSMTAGTYLCNLVFYRLLRLAERLPGRPPCGFIHLPFPPQEAARLQARTAGLAQPSMAMEMQRQAVEIALRTILAPRRLRRGASGL